MIPTLSNREVVLGVTGSIAAYKACEIASRLVEYGAHVTPVLTRSALELVGAASFEAITGRRAITAMFTPYQNEAIDHIAVSQRADLFLIAPATANIIAKAAHGLADDWLSTSLLAARAPVLFAPAMNAQMYAHAAVQANIETLRNRGAHFVGPDRGRLACGDAGLGRMTAPMSIVEAAVPLVSGRNELAGRRVVLTSGGTREPIDPVRYISNRSSGKMGRAIALAALARGAAVTVVTGPCEEPLPYGAEVIRVETAREMAEAVGPLARKADVVIGVAAVADYRPAEVGSSKRKRTGTDVQLSLIENPDIIAGLGRDKPAGQILVGFAAETDDVVAHAIQKLAKKNLDLLVANTVGGSESGFGCDTVQAALVSAGRNVERLGMITKVDLAERLMDAVVSLLAR
ncbi:MAG TPA: bifunctional phosphopantothenoylcysteine decarboxylase/phosphopantothenate--cysteine ligase CoaBC [Candidatus Hydrogenedentes bacterium]|nr:bifunctional phosphopantothenoylcysteine decarboxylase/phosphopantothenate--cysteine ligase CoaBC [Candidatus Hydrogenedentota bacterium]HPG66406.1 bifunctional phosphopantothenoylcysteine decarboxylase/phosphopantothenate--cysteine ligase CoaBC [Candidatus Hydrogenedentota bacterium]